MSCIRIYPSTPCGLVRAPPSKSHTHRALILASLCTSPVRIKNPLLAEDTLATIDAILGFGSIIAHPGKGSLVVQGELRTPDKPINVRESGTTLRLMAGVAGLVPGETTLTGYGSLLRRPMRPLLTSLEDLGARTSSDNGFPPVHVSGKMRGGKTSITGEMSSQFISSLMISGPLTENGVEIHVTGKPVSRPYLRLTESLLTRFGIWCEMSENLIYLPGGQTPSAANYTVPGDFSSASFILSAAAISSGSDVTVTGLTDREQADAGIVSILSSFGANVSASGSGVRVRGEDGLHPVALDLHDSPDLFPVACILAAKAKGTSRIRCSHLRFKESDRITAMYRLLVGIGVEARELEDGVEIFGRGHIPGGEIPAINDHRVIMAGAIAGIPSEKGTTIQNADAVRKSYPGFFDDLKALNVSMEGEG